MRLGKEAITDEQIERQINVAVTILGQFETVKNGPLFILQALIHTVDGRIESHVPKFLDWVLKAMKMEATDAMGNRIAIGMVSDLGIALKGPAIAPHLTQIMPNLYAIIREDRFDIQAKVLAIQAFGDICLTSGFDGLQPYSTDTQTVLKEVGVASLADATNDREAARSE